MLNGASIGAPSTRPQSACPRLKQNFSSASAFFWETSAFFRQLQLYCSQMTKRVLPSQKASLAEARVLNRSICVFTLFTGLEPLVIYSFAR
jgi:hypothetical protein